MTELSQSVDLAGSTVERTSREPLKLYWWNNTENFGDALGRDVVARLSGRTVVWSKEKDADMFSAGSIMWHVRKGVKSRSNIPPPIIWGTGCMKPIDVDWLDSARICAVRGPLTAGVLCLAPLPFGDPGLLATEIVRDVPKTEQVGIVPHHTNVDKNPYLKSLGLLHHIKIIDPRNNSPAEVIREIASCCYVYSQSLHGLIVADAFNVPNRLIYPEGIHGGANPWFKFYDYAGSISRKLESPVCWKEILSDCVKSFRIKINYQQAISEVAEGLKDTFPKELKAGNS